MMLRPQQLLLLLPQQDKGDWFALAFEGETGGHRSMIPTCWSCPIDLASNADADCCFERRACCGLGVTAAS